MDKAVSALGAWPAASVTKAFRDREPQRVGRRHHGGLGHGFVFDQRAFQFERADAVAAGFEDVVGAADIGEIAIGVAGGDVAGAVEGALDGLKAATVLLVALHERGGGRVEREADDALFSLVMIGVEQADAVAGQGAAH